MLGLLPVLLFRALNISGMTMAVEPLMSSSIVCPAPSTAANVAVILPLMRRRFVWFRRKNGIGDDKLRDLRPLLASRDGDACRKLNTMFVGQPFDAETTSRSYYTAPGYYFAAFVDRSDPRLRQPWATRVFVMDDDFKLVANIAPKTPRLKPKNKP